MIIQWKQNGKYQVSVILFAAKINIQTQLPAIPGLLNDT